MHKKITTKSREETVNFGREVASKLKEGTVLCLFGDLGSGKTTFTSGIVNYFLPEKRVLSPTFIIVRHYKVSNHDVIKNIYHMDLYRMEKEQDLEHLEIYDYFAKPENLIIIEWPEKLEKRLPGNKIDYFFSVLDETSREVKVINE
jgi:tRNA threonylcarbamoyladenosine biosynthesis protein TsaE